MFMYVCITKIFVFPLVFKSGNHLENVCVCVIICKYISHDILKEKKNVCQDWSRNKFPFGVTKLKWWISPENRKSIHFLSIYQKIIQFVTPIRYSLYIFCIIPQQTIRHRSESVISLERWRDRREWLLKSIPKRRYRKTWPDIRIVGMKEF